MSRRMPLFLLFLYFQVALAGASGALEHEDIILVVGKVDGRSARVLFDRTVGDAGRAQVGKEIIFRLYEESDLEKYIDRVSRIIEDRPRVFEFDHLKPNTSYTVSASIPALDLSATMRFVTLPNEMNNVEGYIIFGSCNRVYEDGDFSHLNRLAKEKENRRVLMIHLGDQVYTDSLHSKISRKEIPGLSSQEEILELYRDIYRKTWGLKVMQRILRNGGNIMMADDHEIVNNIRPELLNQSSMDTRMFTYFHAGKLAFLEYQLQLSLDLPSLDSEFPKTFFNFSIGENLFLLLDTRFEKSFNEGPYLHGNALIGDRQMEHVKALLSSSIAKSSDQLFVFTPVPLALKMPRICSHVAYFVEGDLFPMHPKISEDTFALLNLLMSEFDGNITLFAGDVHFFSDSQLCLTSPKNSSTTSCFRQIVSSGLTGRSTVIQTPHLYLFDFVCLGLLSNERPPWKITFQDAFLGKNYALLHYKSGQSINIIPRLAVADMDSSQLRKQELFLYFLRHGGFVVKFTITSLVIVAINLYLIQKIIST